MGFLRHECKITVIDKKCFTDYQEQYLADPKSGSCPFFNVGDAFLLKRTPQQDDFYDAMNRSSLRDAAWVRHRFGFDGEPCALAAAARDYGLSISRARHIEDEALCHIRENLAAQGREKAAA